MLNQVKNSDLKLNYRSNSNLNVENPISFLDYLEGFISNASTKRVKGYGTVGLAFNTIRAYKSLVKVIREFESYSRTKLYLHNIYKVTADQLTQFLSYKCYSDNYCGQQLKLIKIILKDAHKSGYEIHPYSVFIETFKQKTSERIIHILTLDEIQQVKALKNITSQLVNSYKWFLIGLSIGQRISDLLSLQPYQIGRSSSGLYIDIVQQKTKKAVTVGVVDPMVIDLLLNQFPQKVSLVEFNKCIKHICRLAGINEEVQGFKINPKTRRKEFMRAPKYKFMTSHIMRRSFASNYYRKIETLLMNIIGHSKESTFLAYIGTNQNKDALADLFMEKVRAI